MLDRALELAVLAVPAVPGDWINAVGSPSAIAQVLFLGVLALLIAAGVRSAGRGGSRRS